MPVFTIDSVATVNVGVGAEYKLENLPVSLFATYDFYASDADGNVETTLLGLDQQRVMVGAKFSIGEDSLFARDRSGASLKPVESPMSIFTVPSSAP